MLYLGDSNLLVYCGKEVSLLLKADTKQFSYKDTYESDQDEEVKVSQSYEYAPGRTR